MDIIAIAVALIPDDRLSLLVCNGKYTHDQELLKVYVV